MCTLIPTIPKLYEVLTATVKDLLSAQDELGRISSYAVSHEFDGWDLWGRKYVLLGMQYYLEICQDEEFKETIVKSMCRQVDYLISKIGDPEDGKILITKSDPALAGLKFRINSGADCTIVQAYKGEKIL